MEIVTYEKLYSYNPDKSRKTFVDTKFNIKETYEYNEAGLLCKEMYSDGRYREHAYNAEGLMIRTAILSANGVILGEAFMTYNESGLLAFHKMMNGVVTNYSYDTLGRVTIITTSLGDNTTYVYNAIGRDGDVNENGNNTKRIQKKFTDRQGKEIYLSTKEVYSNNLAHIMEYNEFGELTHFKNSAGFEYSKEYNEAGKEIKYTSNTQTMVYVYDDDNNLVKQYSNGELMYERTYEAGKILTFRNVSSGETEVYTYNTDGLLEKIEYTEHVEEDLFM